MPGYTKIAVAGATGNLGPAIIQELVNANLSVTILSQSGNTSSLPSSVKTIKVDYSSPSSLKSALTGQEVFLSLVPDFNSQPALIDAAIAAGVQRFIPSEFGSNTSGNAKVAALPVFAGKIATQQYLQERTDQISYTLVHNGLFLDWGLQVGFWAKLKNEAGPTPLYDGGNAKRSTTRLADVGKAVVGILANPEETKNRTVYIQSTALSQRQILKIAQKVNPEFKAETVDVSTEDSVRKFERKINAGEAFEQGEFLEMIGVSIFREEFGGLWDEKNDNEVVGLKELSEEEVEAEVAKWV
jgi:uncharacterized protein YbjT (DUF2867 family)